ncbi:MAG: hypothetical protein ACRD3M_07965 [Thermoanaerobaculia bacterium]
MRRRHLLWRLALAAWFGCASGSHALGAPPARAPEAREEQSLDARGEAQEGVRLFQARDFAAAQEHFERSLTLDPTSVETRFLLARTLQTRFRLSRDEMERSQIAPRAIAAYEEVLTREPGRNEAYQALLSLCREADDAAALPWLERQAGDATLPPGRRADALQVLAVRGRACAEGKLQVISEQPILVDSSEAARDCAMRGLASIQEALRLVPQRVSAWDEQARLLATLAQISELQGQAEQKDAYVKEAAASRRKAEQIRQSKARKGKPPRSY